MFESQLIQMPGPRDIVIYRPSPRAFPVVQKPRGWAHISVQKPRGARWGGGGMVTGQIDTCIMMSYRHAKVIALASWGSGGAVRSPGQSLRGGPGVGSHRSSENPEVSSSKNGL